MDGNRRYAREKDLPTYQGHEEGAEVWKQVVRWVGELGIPHAVFYAFSTENWNRSREEVDALMTLFLQVLTQLQEQAVKEQYRVRFIGERSLPPQKLINKIEEVEKATADYPSQLTVWIALSYGGRAEIVQAVNKAVEREEVVDEETFSALLETAGMPDPDLIIRTGGEKRLSNFLPYQSVYSEFIFTDTYWPAFTNDEFLRMVEEYESRQRRKGK